MPEIKGDYQGKLKTIKATADAKLETVSAIDAGTNVIGNIDRVATVGQSETHIEQYGTQEPLQGTAHAAYTVPKADRLGVLYNLRANRDRDLVTAPGWTGTRRVKLLTDDDWRLKLATLGTVETVKEVEHLGTIGDITHLGSIGNVSFDQGSVSDHKRHMYMKSNGTWISVDGDPIGLYTRPFFHDNGGYAQPHLGDYGQLRSACAWDGAEWVSLSVDSAWQLKTAPARSRKGVVQTVANAGTAVALVASSTPCIGVIVQADYENLGTIYVGDSTVDDTHGFKLRRDKFISFSCQNAGSVYIDASRNAQKVSALYINY